MNLYKELRAQADEHPLDVDLTLFDAAAVKIKELERALLRVTESNSNWPMSMDDRDEALVNRLLRQASS